MAISKKNLSIKKSGVKMRSFSKEISSDVGLEDNEMDLNANFQIGTIIRRYLKEAIRHAREIKGISRIGVADKMTELLGETITESMLNKYTRKKYSYRFPIEWLPAFCKVTGDFRLISFIPGIFGMKVLDSKESIIKEIREIERVEEQVKKRRKDLESKLTEIGGKS